MNRRKVVMLGLVLLFTFYISVNGYSDVTVPEDIRLDTDETADSSGSSFDPKISSDGNGHVYVTWYDYVNGNTDIYFNYSSNYGVTWQTNEIRLDTGDTAGASDSEEPSISSDGSGHVYVIWQDFRNGNTDIYFNYSSNYGVTWQTSDIRLDTGDTAGASTSLDPRISSDGSGHVYVTWHDYRNGNTDIYFNYSSNYGVTWQTSDIRLDTGDTAGASTSLDPEISSDGSGHVYVTWQDYRNGKADIYFNYSSNYGATWQTSGIIRLDTGDTAGASWSEEHSINNDGNGHVYVTWQDYRNGNSDIYFNYSSNYGVTWQTSDIRLDTGDTAGASESEEPHISSDGSGHVYVTWQDERNGKADIYFNYSSDYGVTWQTSDIRLDTGDTAGASESEEPHISSDGSGHVYVTWQDGRNEFDIYFNYSSDYGVTWQTSDIMLNVEDGWSFNPEISSDGNGHVYVTWHKLIFGSIDIYFDYSSNYGATWQTSGIRLDTSDFTGSWFFNPEISSDGSGHVYVAWVDSIQGIYFNHSSDYGVTWQADYMWLKANSAYNENLPCCDAGHQINSDDNGHVYVTWFDGINENADIYFNYSSDYGATWPWLTGVIRLDTGDTVGANTSLDPSISSDDNGHVYVTWEDYRNGKADIYFNYSSNYGVTWQTSGIRLDTGDTAGASESEEPRISSDGSGHVYVTWQDERNGDEDIYFNYSSNYGVTWQTSGIRLDTGDTAGANESEELQISSDGSGHVYVTWEDYRNGKADIYFNYSSDYGVTWQTSDIRLDIGDTAGASDSGVPSISSDGGGHVYVTWEDYRNGMADIYFNYSCDYGVTWQTSDIRLDTGVGASDSEDPSISSDGSGRVYVTWQDERNGMADIYFNYSNDYGATWQTSDIRLDTGDTAGASDSEEPRISNDGSGHVYVTWLDGRNGRTDIYFNTLYISGVSCSYSISPTIQSFGSSGGTGSVSVCAPSACSWTATSNDNWITITSGSSGSGDGTVNYSVSENTSADSRTGTITIANQTFTVTQEGSDVICSYTISPESKSFASDGGTGSVSVSTASDCSWTATSNASWIMITTNDSGTGSGSISYSVSANTGTSSRTGTMTIAGETFTVTQEGSDDGVLSAPTNFSATVGECTTSIGTSCTVSMGWTGVSAATGYKLYYGYSSGSYEKPIDLGNVTSVTYNGIPENTYYLAISAYDSSNESDKSDEIALIVGESSVPTNFNATVSDCIDDIFGSSICRVSLSWTGVSGSSGYYLHYGYSSGNYAGIVDVGDVVSVTYAGIAEGTYYLSLTSYDSGGVESGYSDELILEVGSNSVNRVERDFSPFTR